MLKSKACYSSVINLSSFLISAKIFSTPFQKLFYYLSLDHQEKNALLRPVDAGFSRYVNDIYCQPIRDTGGTRSPIQSMLGHSHQTEVGQTH